MLFQTIKNLRKLISVKKELFFLVIKQFHFKKEKLMGIVVHTQRKQNRTVERATPEKLF